MFLCMRTTIDIDERVFRAFKKRAAQRGTTFAGEIEEALQADLLARKSTQKAEPFELPLFVGEGGALIDLNSNEAIQDLIDEEDRAGGGW